VEVPEWEEPEKILLLLLFLLCFVKFIMEEFEYVIVEEKNLGKQEKKKKRNVKIKTNKRFMRSKILGDTGTENLGKPGGR